MDARSKPAIPMTGRELEETLGYLERVCEVVLPERTDDWTREDATDALIAASHVPRLVATIRGLQRDRELLIKERDEERALVAELRHENEGLRGAIDPARYSKSGV